MPGWELIVTRLGHHRHDGRVRTYGTYEVRIDGVAQAGLAGFTLEARGPGDNGPAGKGHNRVREGRYPLGRHATHHYKTEGYDEPYNQNLALPAILYLLPEGVRDGLLVHPAHPPRPGEASDLWLSSIGCVNPVSELARDQSADFDDSGDRTVALIDSLRAFKGAAFHATPPEAPFDDAFIVIRGEPMADL